MGASSYARSAVTMMAGKKIPDKNVWCPIVSSGDAKPLSVTSGFQYGVEVAVVTDKSGSVYGHCAQVLAIAHTGKDGNPWDAGCVRGLFAAIWYGAAWTVPGGRRWTECTLLGTFCCSCNTPQP